MGIGTLSPRSCTTQDYIASSPQESLSLARPMESSPFVLGLQASAKDNNLAINVSIHVPTASGKMANRSIWVNERGEIESYYDKLHLFDYGSLRESNSVDGGKEMSSQLRRLWEGLV